MRLLNNMASGTDAETRWLGNAEQNCLLVFREVVAPITHETHSEFPYCSIYIETWTLWPHNAKDIRINKTMPSLCNVFEIRCTIWHFSTPFVNHLHCQYPTNCSMTCVYYSRKRLCVWKMEACYCRQNKDTSVQREQSSHEKKTKTKLRGLSPQANYTDRATAACRRSLKFFFNWYFGGWNRRSIRHCGH
jgi:hypothetical protein